ncbi:transcriptional regulator [Arthrobacter pigmenti]
MTDIRILVVDDQPIMSQALKTFIDREEGMTCVAMAANGREAVRLNSELCPDIILMDMQMPVMDGVEATREISGGKASATIIAITTFEPNDYLLPALKAGAEGFLLKDARPEEVVEAIRSADQGNAAISPTVTPLLIKAAITDQRTPDEAATGRTATGEAVTGIDQDASVLVDPLTPREHEVLRLVGQGLSNREMARHLFITEATVKAHISKAMDKLQARNRVELVVVAARAGLIDISAS